MERFYSFDESISLTVKAVDGGWLRVVSGFVQVRTVLRTSWWSTEIPIMNISLLSLVCRHLIMEIRLIFILFATTCRKLNSLEKVPSSSFSSRVWRHFDETFGNFSSLARLGLVVIFREALVCSLRLMMVERREKAFDVERRKHENVIKCDVCTHIQWLLKGKLCFLFS